MFKKDQDPEQGFNQRIPGTGGDFIDDNDVEGHRAGGQKEVDESAVPRLPNADGADEDVEAHRAVMQKATDEGESMRKRTEWLDGPGDDVEGHLYSSPSSGQGEYIRRGPDDNPHGER